MLKFDGLRQHFVIAVPLDEVGASHEGSVLAGAAVVVPQIEVGKVNRVAERRARQGSVFVQSIHDVLGGKNLGVCALDDLFTLVVDSVDTRRGVALGADLLHIDLGLKVVWTMGRDSVGEIPAESIGRIVSNLQAVDAAHMAGRAGWHEHVASRQRARIGVEPKKVALGGEHHAVL